MSSPHHYHRNNINEPMKKDFAFTDNVLDASFERARIYEKRVMDLIHQQNEGIEHDLPDYIQAKYTQR